MPTTPFCTDVDLLNWEPNIFRDAPFASQTLLVGTGTLSGTTFTIDTGSFEAAGVTAEHVIALGGEVDGCFPITSVDGTTAISISVMNAPEESLPPISSAGPIPFAIRTFRPQRAIVSQLIAQAAGIDSPDGNVPSLLNANVLKRPCTLGTFQLVYSALAAVAEDDRASQRAEFYERLYRRALRTVTVELDTNGDGQLDERRTLSILRFSRS